MYKNINIVDIPLSVSFFGLFAEPYEIKQAKSNSNSNSNNSSRGVSINSRESDVESRPSHRLPLNRESEVEMRPSTKTSRSSVDTIKPKVFVNPISKYNSDNYSNRDSVNVVICKNCGHKL